ncbi:MAG: MBL fold metallo-hydrolase [Dehalococcoidia bacterium]
MRIDLSKNGTSAYAEQISTPGLGDHSYLVVVGDEAAVIDPQRDITRFESVLAASGARLAAVLETHVHNDYFSGGPELARRFDAAYVLPPYTEARVKHQTLAEGEMFHLGEWALHAIHTPGHTQHHMSYALEAPGGAAAVFTGGSMLVAGAGRTDLVSEELTEPLARDQYRSINRLADELPDPSVVSPTHGSGSFCGSGGGHSGTVSTIEDEKRQNPALTAPHEDAFVREHVAGFGIYPSYYRHMGPTNAVGAPPMPTGDVKELSPTELAQLDHEVWPVDVRSAAEFARGHVPGSVNIPMGDDVGVYTGWALPWNSKIVLITGTEEDAENARLHLARVGIDTVTGKVTDGLARWRSEERSLSSYPTATFADMAAPDVVVDVRDPKEREQGWIPWSVNVHFSQIRDRIGDVPEGRAWVHCTSGFRAAIGASLLHRLGRDVVLVQDEFENYPGVLMLPTR